MISRMSLVHETHRMKTYVCTTDWLLIYSEAVRSTANREKIVYKIHSTRQMKETTTGPPIKTVHSKAFHYNIDERDAI